MVDAVIALIKKLSTATGDKFGKVDEWLYERDSVAKFPVIAFR